MSVSPCGLSMSGWGLLPPQVKDMDNGYCVWSCPIPYIGTICGRPVGPLSAAQGALHPSSAWVQPGGTVSMCEKHCEHVCDGWWYTLFNSLLFWVSCRSAPIRDWDKTFRDGGWYLLNMSIRIMKYFLPPHSCSPTEGGGARLSSQPLSWCKCETVSILKLLLAVDAPAVPPLLKTHTRTTPQPEGITGSTRMKGGTATKMILETIFSTAHCRLMHSNRR